ncbi:hypothetical protein MR626_13225 [bacterium]|nr:hypothetical protein [bacterium]
MEIFKLFGSVLVNTSGAEGSLDKTGKKAEGLGSTFSSVFKKIGAVVTTYLSAKALINFGRECIELASDVQEMENKFNVVFQGMTDEVNAWAESYAAAIGRNANTIKGYLADNQNMFVGMGMTRQAGAALSEQMVSLALDLASFNNLNEDDAVNAMAKALMGESESAKSLGAVINDNTLAMAMEKMGYEGKFQALTEAEKMEVRYQAILMQSTDAVGDCARSLDSYKGRQLQLKATTEKLKETIGSALLPVMTKLMEKANDAASGLSNKLEPAMELVSSGAMFVVDHLDEIVTGLTLVGGAIVTLKAGFTLQKLVTGFQQAQVSVALLQMTTKGAALEQAALNGTLTAGETVVAILTGKISVMSLATAGASKTVAGLNAAIAANPIGMFVAALGLMAGGIYASRKKIQALADDMVIQAQTTAEAEENLAQLKERLDEFEGNPNKWGIQKREEYAALKQAISETEEQLVQLQQAEEEAAAAAAEKAADPVEIFRSATEQYANDAAALAESFWETYDNIYSKVSGWFGLFDDASTNVETNVQKMMDAMQSQVDFNTAYTANLQALKEYGLGSLSEAFQSYGKDGAAYAQAIVSAVEQAGGATTEQGQQIINGFLEINQKVSESQNDLSQTLTLLDGEFEGELKSMNETYAAAIAGLDKSKDAKKYAYDTFQAFLDGMNKRIPGIVDKCKDLGRQMNNAIQSGLSSKTVSATFTVYGGESSSSSASSAKAYSSQDNISYANSAPSRPQIVINQYIQQVPQTAADTAAATEAYFEQARWAIP